MRPILRDEDWEHLKRAVEAAEQSVLCVSLDARRGGDPLRRCEWPDEIRKGFWEELKVDPVVVEDFRVSIDTITCVVSISFYLGDVIGSYAILSADCLLLRSNSSDNRCSSIPSFCSREWPMPDLFPAISAVDERNTMRERVWNRLRELCKLVRNCRDY